PRPRAMANHLNPLLAEAMAAPELTRYGRALTTLDALDLPYILNALQQMGLSFTPGGRFSETELLQRLQVATPHHRLFSRLLRILAEKGMLRREDERWEILPAPPLPHQDVQDLDALTREMMARHPEAETELTLLNRCGSSLARVLQGKIDPVRLLFPEGDLATAASLYRDAPGARLMNGALQNAFRLILEDSPAHRKLRVLEIGAGTGATTAGILPLLENRCAEYMFTDISPGFLTRAGARFTDAPFLRRRILDIEKSPGAQGFRAGARDVVLAVNVLHATRDLGQTLEHARQLLKPGGLLLLLEAVTPLGWVDLIFGLTDGWWRFTDLDRRPRHPLIGISTWKALIEEVGFEEPASVSPDPRVNRALAKQAILMARRPAENRTREGRNWLILADRGKTGEALADHLARQGDACILVHAGDAFERISGSRFRIHPTRPGDFRRLLEETANRGPGGLHGVVHAWSLDAPGAESLTAESLEAALAEGAGSLPALVQALDALEFDNPPALWLATRNAQPAGRTPDLSGLAMSPAWGMGKTIALERPGIWGGMVDLPGGSPGEDAAILANEIRNPDGEDHIAVRAGRRYIARLEKAQPPAPRETRIHSDAVYLITGGAGALGLKAARLLVDRGARHLTLTGRRGAPSEAAREEIQRLERRGVEVRVRRADAAQEEEMDRLIREITAARPLRGVIHAAGLPGYTALSDMNLS
ncbi:MAG: SDR family NAD(P)-dependent oxidoreductase, partial [Desulfobacterales bacterium]|nr:SDR family NAD(P)-dependent oxidoreductase [Desulfobacterales bacterium]